jgi:hypothetical protein
MGATNETRVVVMIIAPAGSTVLNEFSTRVEIQDEGGGEFVEVSQGSSSINIDPTEWPRIKAAIDKLIKNCRS